uniref:Fucosyltransferase n=1 Tax=Parascaris univalens TaxID=6257 RepID=A0A915BI81_PARUN
EMWFAIRVVNRCAKQPRFSIIVVMLLGIFSLIRIPIDLVHPINHFAIAYATRGARPHLENFDAEEGTQLRKNVGGLMFRQTDEPLPNPEPPALPQAQVSHLTRHPRWIYRNNKKTYPSSRIFEKNTSCFHLSSIKYGDLCVESIVGDYNFTLADKLYANVRTSDQPKLILSLEEEITQASLGGCPEWNCRILDGISLKYQDADAIVFGAINWGGYTGRSSQQYVVFVGQEADSSSAIKATQIPINMTMNFFRNSPISSPYGYTVKLAPISRRYGKLVNEVHLQMKSKAVAWFVSNCNAASGRDQIISELQKYIDVDIFGFCGNKRCNKGDICEQRLNTEYLFYASFENAICKDYITEKLWHQGFNFDIVPLVLKRGIVEKYLPPHSFIAIDDFSSLAEMAKYLQFLRRNKTAYMQYFEWKKDYAVIHLDGVHHDQFEKPWGVCQLCRLLWETPRPHYELNKFDEYSC